MSRSALMTLLATASDTEIVRQLLGSTPWIFRGDTTAFATWRSDAAKAAGCSADGVFVVGSSVFGYSLSPYKPGRPFREHNASSGDVSDIDMAIVSERLFAEAWDAVRGFDRHRALASTREGRAKIRTDVYWGYVSGITLPSGCAPAVVVRGALARTTSQVPFRGHPAKARIYRRKNDLSDYHVESVRALRKSLEGTR